MATEVLLPWLPIETNDSYARRTPSSRPASRVETISRATNLGNADLLPWLSLD